MCSFGVRSAFSSGTGFLGLDFISGVVKLRISGAILIETISSERLGLGFEECVSGHFKP